MKPGEVSIKFVKRANMWCKTWFEVNEKTGAKSQKIEWYSEKPDESI